MWDNLARKREEMIEAEKAKKVERASVEKQSNARQKGEVEAEAIHAREKTEEQEEWRRQQHAKREAEAAKKRAAEAEALRQKELKEKKEKEDAIKQKHMEELHKRAVEKKVEARIENAKLEETRQKKMADAHEVREFRTTDDELRRRFTEIDREAKKKGDLLKAGSARKRAQAEERLKAVKGDDASGNEFKRAIMNADEALDQGLFDIQTEAKRLKAEALLQSDRQKQRDHTEAEKKRREAQAKREGVEEWFGRGKEKLIKGPLDLS